MNETQPKSLPEIPSTEWVDPYKILAENLWRFVGEPLEVVAEELDVDPVTIRLYMKDKRCNFLDFRIRKGKIVRPKKGPSVPINSDIQTMRPDQLAGLHDCMMGNSPPSDGSNMNNQGFMISLFGKTLVPKSPYFE